MRSACSRAATAVLAVGVALAPLPLPATADIRWRRGVFPVVNFLSYTSHFGFRIGPGGSQGIHSGLDIAAPLGSPIRNWWGGVVSDVISDGRCGLGLVIRSGPYEHMYCHMGGQVNGGVYSSGAVVMARGQQVRAGERIGHIGLTGRTTGPHLHWGIRYRGHWLDPALILRAMVRSRRVANGGR